MDPSGCLWHAGWPPVPNRSEVWLELTKQRSARWDPIRALLLWLGKQSRERDVLGAPHRLAEGVGF